MAKLQIGGAWRLVLGVALLTALSMPLAGCGGGDGGSKAGLKDGTYKAQSSKYINKDEADQSGNGYGEVTLTIQGGKIAKCDFKTYELDGKLKGKDYGKGEGGTIANRDYYNKAQKALLACDKYAQKLVEKGNLAGVDSISGATINFKHFQEGVQGALAQAQGK